MHIKTWCIHGAQLSHERAVHRIGTCLKATSDKEIILKPDGSRGIEWYVDADIAGGWDTADSGNSETVLSRTRHLIIYTNCPDLFCSKLQTELKLFTTEE